MFKNQWRAFVHKAEIGHKTLKPENDLVANRPQLKCSASSRWSQFNWASMVSNQGLLIIRVHMETETYS